MLSSLNNYEVAAVAYIAGQFFHVKYVVIFGLNRLFALIDGLTPPGPPICISRVSKYGQMWRYFDQGLYQFLKRQVYIPLLHSSPNSNQLLLLLRRLFAMSSVFLFVLAWHGLNSNYFHWTLLSAFELIIERIGRDLIEPSSAWKKLKELLGEGWIFRLKSLGMIFTVIPGIFGVFFFLCKADVGAYVCNTVLIKGLAEAFRLKLEVAGPGFVICHLLVLGYCFNAVCLYLEHKLMWNELYGKRRRNKEE